MSLLVVHHENRPEHSEIIREHAAMAERLAAIGVRFERWTADQELGPETAQDAILEAYRKPVDCLKRLYDFRSVDVISIGPDHPQKDGMRATFRNEHTHNDFEVRFFVEGRGLFFLHPNENVYAVLCEQGDLISVPAGVQHWFDMGEFPAFKCIRLFTRPEGWAAEFTGTAIDRKFPGLEQFLSAYVR